MRTEESTLFSIFKPSTNLGKSAGFLGWTATRKICIYEYLTGLIGWNYFKFAQEIVPASMRYWSILDNTTKFPEGIYGKNTVLLPMIWIIYMIFI